LSLILDNGYLNGAYLNRDSYLGGDALNAQNMQVLRVINGTLKPSKFQVLRNIASPFVKQFQVLRQITSGKKSIRWQVKRVINGTLKSKLFQVSFSPVKPRNVNISAKRGRILHTINADRFYLASAYLSDTYLSNGVMAWVPFQVRSVLTKGKAYRFEIDRVITDVRHSDKFQIQRRINVNHAVGFQVNRIQFKAILYQVNRILYNTKRLRVLLDFASRGTTGSNWTASSTAPGDFSVNNLNTDIVEQCWRSNPGGSKIVALTCNTQVSQGVFVDTIAILGHNLTRSATIEVQASNDPTFAVYKSFFIETNRTANIYWVAPTAPTSSYTYWRFYIADTTNTNPYLQIGSIVFGSSILMVANDITDSVRRSTKHFSDKVQTEGFTNVANDRAIKYGLGVEFRSIAYDGTDYTNLRRIFDTARTSLKCLWIPTPEYPERFAVFGKLSAIPEEQHNALGPTADYVSFNVDVDESL
jgi:hypothetical protein